MRRILLMALGLLSAANAASDVRAQQARVGFDLVNRPIARLQDQSQIRFFMDELILEPLNGVESVEYLEVIDITNNGFGPDDVVVAYPSQETFYLYPGSVPEDVQNMMLSWIPPSENRFDSGNLPADYFNPETDSLLTTSRERAKRAILYDLWRSLDRNYSAMPINVLFQRADSAFSFQIWGFREQNLSYVPPPRGIPDTTLAFDLLHVIRRDSLVIADTTIFDVLVLEKTIEETVYLPGGPGNSVSSRGPGSDGITRRDELDAAARP